MAGKIPDGRGEGMVYGTQSITPINRPGSQSSKTFEKLAEEVVGSVINKASRCVEERLGVNVWREGVGDSPRIRSPAQRLGSAGSEGAESPREGAYHKEEGVWPTGAEFDVDKGLAAILRYIETEWALGRDWKYSLRHKETVNADDKTVEVYDLLLQHRDYLIDRVQVTCGVEFRLEVIVPEVPVRVSYTIESTRFCHTPDTFKFRETWITQVLRNKCNIVKQVVL